MSGSIHFHYLPIDDIVVAVPHWHIATVLDVMRWYSQYDAYLSPFKRPMDLIVVLDHFSIETAMGKTWGDARARMHQRFTAFSCRVNSDARVRLFVQTSGVRLAVSSQEAASLEDGIDYIKEERRRLAAEKKAERAIPVRRAR